MLFNQVVSNTSKILKRKQITTEVAKTYLRKCCFQYVKDTKKKANHNRIFVTEGEAAVVSNTSKILKLYCNKATVAKYATIAS